MEDAVANRVTLTDGADHHVYHDVFDNNHVFMEISVGAGFDLVLNQDGERVTVRVNKHVARAMNLITDEQFGEIDLKFNLTGEEKFYRCTGRCSGTFPSSACRSCEARVSIPGRDRDCIDVACSTLDTHLKSMSTDYGTTGMSELEDCVHVHMADVGSVPVPRFWMGWAVFIHLLEEVQVLDVAA